MSYTLVIHLSSFFQM